MSQVKPKSIHYQQNILEPIFEEEIPALYRNEIDTVERDMDKASSDVSKSSAAYLAKKESETGIKCIPFNETPVKSPDASPKDFCAFGLLKQALRKGFLKKRPTGALLMYKDNRNQWIAVGMDVSSFRCAIEAPRIYMKIYDYVQWIEESTANGKDGCS